MVGSIDRLAAATVLAVLLAGCAGTPDFPSASIGGRTETRSPLQCVPYARDETHIAIYGDAYTWWDQAAGRYARSYRPSEGSVMVLYGYAGPDRAHLAVVKEIVGDREIRIDHANWLDDGAIYTDDPVRDVSAAGDWSQVRVFNLRTGAWGTHAYPVQGFIGPGPDDNPVLVAGRGSPGPLRMAQRPAREPDQQATPESGAHDYVADLLDGDPSFDADAAASPADDTDQ